MLRRWTTRKGAQEDMNDKRAVVGSNSSASRKTRSSPEGSMSDSSTTGYSSATGKFCKIGRRLRDGCRNFRRKNPTRVKGRDPKEYCGVPAPNESMRSKHFVPMDFSGYEARIVNISDLPTKEGYPKFRRKCVSGNVEECLTDSQKSVHKSQSWFHPGVSRDGAQRIILAHAVDGLFLVRDSRVSGGFVISYYFAGKVHHAQALPDLANGVVTYSIDSSRTRFFDLLQMVEYYRLNKGILGHCLTHFVVRSTEKLKEPLANELSSCSSSSTTAAKTVCPEEKNAGDEASTEVALPLTADLLEAKDWQECTETGVAVDSAPMAAPSEEEQFAANEAEDHKYVVDDATSFSGSSDRSATESNNNIKCFSNSDPGDLQILVDVNIPVSTKGMTDGCEETEVMGKRRVEDDSSNKFIMGLEYEKEKPKFGLSDNA